MAVKPHDDPSILDEDYIIRGIVPSHLVPDEHSGRKRVSSMAFSASTLGSRGMSVNIKKDIESAGIDPASFAGSRQYLGTVELRAGIPRREGLIVGREPLNDNPFHGEVWNSKEGRKFFSKAQRKAMLKNSRWLNEIDNVGLNPAD